MTTFQFRNGFEEGVTSKYALAFQCTLDYDVEILIEISGYQPSRSPILKSNTDRVNNR